MSEAFVVFLRVHLHLPTVGSLKGKRAELNHVKAMLRQRMGAAVAEVDHQDTWQRATLAIALCAGAPGRARDGVDAVARLLDSCFPDGVRVEWRIASWEDLEAIV